MAIRSNIRARCSSCDSGMPTGASGSVTREAFCFSVCSIRCSISRTLVEVITETAAVACAELAAQGTHFPLDGLEDALLVPEPRGSLRGIPRPAEHALEHGPGVDFHRHRRRGIAPGNRVLVDAAVTAGARTDRAREVFGGDLEGREERLATQLCRHRLVDRRPVFDIVAFGHLGVDAGQPSGRGARVRVGAANLVAQAADNDRGFPERLERLQNRRELEVGTRRFGVQLDMSVPFEM